MRRTKEWWARLTAWERSSLVALERASNELTPLGGYVPDDCGECPGCSVPVLGGGLCPNCANALDTLIEKANGILEEVSP